MKFQILKAILLQALLVCLFTPSVSAINPPSPNVRPIPPVIFVMSDWSNGDWGNSNWKYQYKCDTNGDGVLDSDCEYIGHPEWGPVGGWWDFNWGKPRRAGGYSPASIEQYIKDAAKMTVTLDDGTKIPKPVGVGIPFTLENIQNYTYLNNPEFKNLAFIIASSPISDCSKYGEITQCTAGWAKEIMGPLSEAFPNIPIFFQGDIHTLPGLGGQAVTMPNKNIAVKFNGWSEDTSGARQTRDGIPIGGTMDFADIYGDRIIVGYEPVAGGLAIEEWYWAVMQALYHHSDFFDIQGAILHGMASIESKHGFPLLRFMRDHMGKTTENTPDVWVVLRETSNMRVCSCEPCLAGETPSAVCFKPRGYCSHCQDPICAPCDYGEAPDPSCKEEDKKCKQPWYCYWIGWSTGNPRTICAGPDKGNFAYWLYQLDDIEGGKTVVLTSNDLPLPAKSHLYGQYTVRRTDQENNQPYMYFNIDDRYQLSPGTNAWEINLTFVNQGTDKLTLEYTNKSGQTIKKSINKGEALGETNNWIDYKWTLTEADFPDNKLNGIDFRINCEGDGDEVIHRVIAKPIFIYLSPTPSLTPTQIPQPTGQFFYSGWQQIELKAGTQIPQNCQVITYKENGFWKNFLSYLNNLFYAQRKKKVWVKCN